MLNIEISKWLWLLQIFDLQQWMLAAKLLSKNGYISHFERYAAVALKWENIAAAAFHPFSCFALLLLLYCTHIFFYRALRCYWITLPLISLWFHIRSYLLYFLSLTIIFHSIQDLIRFDILKLEDWLITIVQVFPSASRSWFPGLLKQTYCNNICLFE